MEANLVPYLRLFEGVSGVLDHSLRSASGGMWAWVERCEFGRIGGSRFLSMVRLHQLEIDLFFGLLTDETRGKSVELGFN